MVATLTAIVKDLRCWRCNRELAKLLTIPYRIDCPRCKAVNQRLD